MIKFEKKNKPATEEDIKEFERSISILLPKSYKNFLLKANGGIPIITDNVKYHVKIFDPIKKEKIGQPISEFLDNLDPEYFDFLAINLLPIAITWFGDAYLIRINDEDDDSIYFADLHEATHKKIFNSFQEFLNHLQNG